MRVSDEPAKVVTMNERDHFEVELGQEMVEVNGKGVKPVFTSATVNDFVEITTQPPITKLQKSWRVT